MSSYEVDLQAKQIKTLGSSSSDDYNASSKIPRRLIQSFLSFVFSFSVVCWSPQGKQFVIGKYDGALELYEPTMTLKKTYPSVTNNPAFPPCISVYWVSTRQFLLGFADNNPGEDSFFHVLVTFDKVRSSHEIDRILSLFIV